MIPVPITEAYQLGPRLPRTESWLSGEESNQRKRRKSVGAFVDARCFKIVLMLSYYGMFLDSFTHIFAINTKVLVMTKR